jgi:hypothetical protein
LPGQFPGDEDVKTIVEREIDRLNDWISDHSAEEPDEKPTRKLGDVGTPDHFEDARSIFDDVDA